MKRGGTAPSPRARTKRGRNAPGESPHGGTPSLARMSRGGHPDGRRIPHWAYLETGLLGKYSRIRTTGLNTTAHLTVPERIGRRRKAPLPAPPHEPQASKTFPLRDGTMRIRHRSIPHPTSVPRQSCGRRRHLKARPASIGEAPGHGGQSGVVVRLARDLFHQLPVTDDAFAIHHEDGPAQETEFLDEHPVVHAKARFLVI